MEKAYLENQQKYQEERKEANPEMANAGDLLGGDTDPQLQAIFAVQNHIQVRTVSFRVIP